MGAFSPRLGGRVAERNTLLFVAEHTHTVHVRPRKDVFSPKTGEKIDTIRAITAKFSRGWCPAWAVPLAESRFNFVAKPEVIAIPQWIACLDTGSAQLENGWTDEERKLVEQAVSSMPGSEVMHVEPPALPAPWPNYDELTVQGRRTAEVVAAKNLATAAEIGVSVQSLIDYEKQNRNDERIVELYAQHLDRPLERTEELVEA